MHTCWYIIDILNFSVKLIGYNYNRLHVIIGDRRGYRIKGVSSNDKVRPVESQAHYSSH